MAENYRDYDQERNTQKHTRYSPNCIPKRKIQQDNDGTEIKRRTHEPGLENVSNAELQHANAQQHKNEQAVTFRLGERNQRRKQGRCD